MKSRRVWIRRSRAFWRAYSVLPCSASNALILSNSSCTNADSGKIFISVGKGTKNDSERLYNLPRRCPLFPKRGGPFSRRQHVRLTRKDLTQQHAVYLGVPVGTGVGNDGKPVVPVGRLSQGGQYNPARGDPRQYQMIDAPCPQDHLQVAARESADPAFRDDDIPRPRRHDGIDFGIFQARKASAPGKRGEPLIKGADLGETLPEPDDHVNNRNSRRAGGPDSSL